MRFCVAAKLPRDADAPDHTLSNEDLRETSNDFFPIADLSVAGIHLVWLPDKIFTHLSGLENETLCWKQFEIVKSYTIFLHLGKRTYKFKMELNCPWKYPEAPISISKTSLLPPHFLLIKPIFAQAEILDKLIKELTV